MEIVICGGGIVGISIAYYLSKRGLACTIVEEDSVACAASGKAGGFLARTWCESNGCNDLAKLSYQLHMDLARQFKDVDYRNVNTFSAYVDKLHSCVQPGVPDNVKWIDGPVAKYFQLETSENTSQVNPKKLCKRLLQETQRLSNHKSKVVIDSVVNIEFDKSGSLPTVKSVILKSGKKIDANIVVIAMGPWSYKAAKWFPDGSIPKIIGHRAHSIVLAGPESIDIPPDCLFLQYRNNIGVSSPEVYPRPDGTVYVSGFGDDEPVPETNSMVKVEKWRCTQLREVAYATCSRLEASEVLCEQACYLPLSPDGIPLLGRLNKVQGGYVATGHSCWGILNSLGSGLAMAELIETGQCKCIDLQRFDPNRFDK